MRTALYLRVSTQRQSQVQTIEHQLTRLRAHLEEQGETLRPEWIFRDDGYSGATLNRPGLDRLRDAVKAAEVDHVLITTPDRLARNYVHQMVLLEELERTGCSVEFLERPMSSDPHDQLVLQIRSAVAEYERTLIAERMRRGRQMKLRAGLLLPWATTPYGYRVDPTRPRDPGGVRIDPAEGAIVRELFTRYLDAPETLHRLVKYLRGLGLPSPRGRAHWSVASVRGILTNPAYTGQVYSGRKRMRPARARRSATHPMGKLAQGWDPMALATLMIYYFGEKTSERDILNALIAGLTPDDLEGKKKRGFSLLDLRRVARAKGYQAAGFKLTSEQLKQLAMPVIVFVQPFGYNHFAVLRGVDRGRVYLADPARGNLRMSMGRFLTEWGGIIFV